MSTFGDDSSLTEITKKYEKVLIKCTKSFIENKNSGLMTYIKKTGTSIKNRLVNNRQFSLSSKVTKSSPCRQRNCKACPMIVNKDKVIINGKKVQSAPGTCHSYNVIYGIICNLCNKCYVGRTTRPLHERITEHRIKFYELLDKPTLRFSDEFHDKDIYNLGLHLVDVHGELDKNSFNRN